MLHSSALVTSLNPFFIDLSPLITSLLSSAYNHRARSSSTLQYVTTTKIWRSLVVEGREITK
uniref:Uncharacterized protein n=1 Tax=Cucumis melo TaxID=3656 RepID=A0A9I9ELR5_CUCME